MRRKTAIRLSFCIIPGLVLAYLSSQLGCSNGMDGVYLTRLGSKEVQQSGTVLIYAGNRIESLDLATKSLRSIVTPDSPADSGSPGMASFSPDTSEITFKEAGVGGDSLVILNMKTGTRRPLLKMAYLDGPRWSPDGTEIVFEGRSTASGEYSLYRYKLEGGALTTVIKGQLKAGEMLFSWASDGKGIVYQDANNGIYVLDLASGERTRIDSGWFPTSSPNHRYIAYRVDGADDPGYIIYDLQTRKKQRILEGKSVYRSLVWSPDSRCLIYSADGRGEYYGDLLIFDLESKSESRVLRRQESVYPTDWRVGD